MLLIWGILVAILPHENNAVLMLVTHPLTFEFIAGALIALLLQRRVVGGGWVAFTALPVWFLAYSFYVYQGGELEPDGWPRVMLFGIPSVLAVYGVVAMEMKSGRQFTGWLKIIGDASYSIYLSHLLVISAMGRIWSTIWQQGLLDNGVAMMAILLMVLIVGIISYRFLERPLMRLTRRYEGLVK